MELDLEAEREINDQLEYDKNQRLDKTNDRKYKNDYRFPSGKKILRKFLLRRVFEQIIKNV